MPVEHARQIYDLCADPRDLVIFPGGDHRISAENHRKMFVKQTAHWLARTT